jgi:hypothetical protein
MATETHIQSRTVALFAMMTDEEMVDRYFEKDFNNDVLASLTVRELDDWINDYVSHLPGMHDLKEH